MNHKSLKFHIIFSAVQSPIKKPSMALPPIASGGNMETEDSTPREQDEEQLSRSNQDPGELPQKTPPVEPEEVERKGPERGKIAPREYPNLQTTDEAAAGKLSVVS